MFSRRLIPTHSHIAEYVKLFTKVLLLQYLNHEQENTPWGLHHRRVALLGMRFLPCRRRMLVGRGGFLS